MGKHKQDIFGKSQSIQSRYMHVILEEVIKDIDEYIVPECQNACRNLWSKNILTFMTSDIDDGEKRWIILGELSEENEEIFKKMMEEDSKHYGIHYMKGGYTISTRGNGEEVSTRLAELADIFEMQDIIDHDGEAYESSEIFVANKFNMLKYVMQEDGSLFIEFDESKMTKPIEEYLEEAGVLDLYDAERDVVYTSEFYRDMHLRYLEHLKKRIKTNPELTPEQVAEEKIRKASEEFDKEVRDDILGKDESSLDDTQNR